jgi:DNA-binding NarL/FixJ family response regulator
VLLVDDHQLVRAGVTTLLQSDPEITVVGEARNGREAIDSVEGTNPDVVLMDLSMPEMDGVEATRAWPTSRSPAPWASPSAPSRRISAGCSARSGCSTAPARPCGRATTCPAPDLRLTGIRMPWARRVPGLA